MKRLSSMRRMRKLESCSNRKDLPVVSACSCSSIQFQLNVDIHSALNVVNLLPKTNIHAECVTLMIRHTTSLILRSLKNWLIILLRMRLSKNKLSILEEDKYFKKRREIERQISLASELGQIFGMINKCVGKKGSLVQ